VHRDLVRERTPSRGTRVVVHRSLSDPLGDEASGPLERMVLLHVTVLMINHGWGTRRYGVPLGRHPHAVAGG